MRRWLLASLYAWAVSGTLTYVVQGVAQEPKDTKRYNIRYDSDLYSQATPKDALQSVLKAVERKQVDYLAAQLIDPIYVDQWIRNGHGTFEHLVQNIQRKFADNPSAVRLLRQFLEQGNFAIDEREAVVTLKEQPKIRVYLKKLDDRWYMENRQDAGNAPAPKAAEEPKNDKN